MNGSTGSIKSYVFATSTQNEEEANNLDLKFSLRNVELSIVEGNEEHDGKY